ISRGAERAVRVVLLEAADGIGAVPARTLGAFAVHDGARCIGGPVAPVGSSGEEDDVALIPELERGRQGHLLTTPALAFPADRHRGLPARDQAGGRWHGSTTRAYRLPVSDQLPGDLAGLALQ